MADQVQSHILTKYSLTKKVGSGAYGHVWKISSRQSGETLALKKIFDAFQHSIDAQRTYRQICYLHEMNHPNIVKLHNVIKADNDKDLYLVFEFMEADLHNAISQKILKDIHNRFILYQICKGIKYLHSAEIIHRDLKPSNILINSDCHLKICDFGLARSLAIDKNPQDIVLTQQVATRWYRAPEVLLGSQTYNKAADIWSVGCILAELLLGKPIFPGTSTLNQLERILSFTGRQKREDIESLNSQIALTMMESINQIKTIPIKEWFKSDTPPEALDLLQKMLQFNPQKRLTICQILKHPYLGQFSNPKEEVESKFVINPPVSDNKKLNLKQYKQLIYERIKNIYSNVPQQHISEHKKSSSSSSLHRHSEVMKDKTNESKIYSNSKSSKPSSANKYHHPSSPTFSSTSHTIAKTSQNGQQQKQKLRKKQSLKQILKNKRQKQRSSHKDKGEVKIDKQYQYRDKTYGNSPVLSKYFKSNITSSYSYLKQNKIFCSQNVKY